MFKLAYAVIFGEKSPWGWALIQVSKYHDVDYESDAPSTAQPAQPQTLGEAKQPWIIGERVRCSGTAKRPRLGETHSLSSPETYLNRSDNEPRQLNNGSPPQDVDIVVRKFTKSGTFG